MRAVLARMLEARAALRRGRIVAAWRELGVVGEIQGEDVRAFGRGLLRRCARDLALREAGRERL